ncbi:glycosyltransferase family protein [Leucobacter tardus]|uniref:Spore protein YkvP/CgeB glycosyl transferase-like domain-containing protein n=1 Tax=Leucobacter tardus TaxID=501483 RepID=A0A939TIQ5_9MICO|nr:hypothetical protein [Leucobacter tardus]MBO2988391.1 hypothetical protein [Leucobacter tardus]
MQRALVGLFDLWFRARGTRAPRISWVIAPNEVAGTAAALARALPNAFTFMRTRHPFYDFQYDYIPPANQSPSSRARRKWISEPMLFARLANSASGFIYLSHIPLLSFQQDERRFEFNFLRRRGVKIVFFFTGSDVRSMELMHQHELETGLPNIATYLGQVAPKFREPAFERKQRAIGMVADEFADEIFTMRVDQRAYIDRETQPYPYLLPDDEISEDLERFEAVERPVILHAPSSPIIKGTQLVRAAVEALRREGFDFEYVELNRVPYEEVKSLLARSHIVLNQFYAHVPGVFGVEAMAAGCVVLMSADEQIEPDLPRGSNRAWVVTKHWEVYHQLKSLLEEPERLRPQAEAGLAWINEHARASVAGPKLQSVLDRLIEP